VKGGTNFYDNKKKASISHIKYKCQKSHRCIRKYRLTYPSKRYNSASIDKFLFQCDEKSVDGCVVNGHKLDNITPNKHKNILLTPQLPFPSIANVNVNSDNTNSSSNDDNKRLSKRQELLLKTLYFKELAAMKESNKNYKIDRTVLRAKFEEEEKRRVGTEDVAGGASMENASAP
jgi:hypothetical protein